MRAIVWIWLFCCMGSELQRIEKDRHYQNTCAASHHITLLKALPRSKD